MINNRVRFWVVLLVLLPLLTACPRTTTPEPGPDPVPADFSIEVSTAAPSFVSGNNTSVTVTISKTGDFDADVTLSINDPAEVTAAFDPVTTKTSSTLTLSGETTGSYDMTITGTSGDKTKTKDITLTISDVPPPATVTISGKALDSFGRPISGAPVVILGQDPSSSILTTTAITSLTNADGEFSLAGVKKPYDIVLVESRTGHATIYQGLTTELPTLTSFVEMYVFYGFGLDDKNGSFKGMTNPLPAPQGEHIHRGVFGSPEATRHFSIQKDGELGGSSIPIPVLTQDSLDTLGDTSLFGPGVNVSWFGPTTTSGVAHVLQWKKDANNLPDAYTGYGKRDILLADSSTTNDQNIPMNTLGSSNAGGTVTVADGYSITNRSMSVILDENSDIEVADEGLKPLVLLQEQLAPQVSLSALPANFNFRTPDITGAKVGIAVGARDSLVFSDSSRYVYLSKTGIDLTDTNINITLPEAPSLALPTNNAPNVNYETEFIWSPSGFSESVNVVFVREVRKRLTLAGINGLALDKSIAIITKDTKVKMPDLSALGITLSPPTSGEAHDYEWFVSSIGPFSTVDSAATREFADAYYDESASKDIFYGDSQRFEFTAVTP